jgi:GntR family phosphonate transport system transcriptional regulator
MTKIFQAPKAARKSGVALWRQIADELRLDIVTGKFASGTRLPGELELATRFGVNRHTVRSALAALQADGTVRAEQGRGTFVQAARRLSYRISRRTRFSEALAGQARDVHGELIAAATEPANASVAAALNLRVGSPVVRLETLSSADGKPLSRATGWFSAARFPGFDQAFAKTGSITRALQEFGVPDYVRLSTKLSARHADTDEILRLKLAPGAIVMVTEGIDADPDGVPIQLGLSRFAAERVELIVDGE